MTRLGIMQDTGRGSATGAAGNRIIAYGEMLGYTADTIKLKEG